MSIIRTRWAAIGAAIAVTLGAGGIGIVSATQPADAVTFVPITPCRVMDTRTEFNVGPKTSPLGPGEVYTVNTTTADTGNCTTIPTTATGVSLNVTALDATIPTFLTIWATGQAQPTASSLNPVPGQPPTPNAVTTAINPGGQFDIYNLQGDVHVLADINGYYTDHHHDDRYYTKTQTDSLVSRSFVVEGAATTVGVDDVTDEVVANTLTVTVPGPGQLVVTATGNYSAILSEGLHPAVDCSLTDEGVFDPLNRSQYEAWNDDSASGRSAGDLAFTRVIDVAAAGDVTLDLICKQFSGDVLVVSRIVAQYVP